MGNKDKHWLRLNAPAPEPEPERVEAIREAQRQTARRAGLHLGLMGLLVTGAAIAGPVMTPTNSAERAARKAAR